MTRCRFPGLGDLSRVVEPQLSGIDGVAKVQTFGGQNLAMRLWLDSDRMAGRGVTAADVAQAVRSNNYQATPGRSVANSCWPISISTRT